ncbi:hypothetical protein NHX12_021865 [Muraenolepis orangiensis]|uniref:RBR-type E3 ubiquitin transferase n=1 Tax=Muraenolepis orangiensis TaxID=630683 RepID=A0A9Q0EWJ8_9TELE|nr:hypothetical protein NHX12_021865 [Muraenolepis orangiensis]
MTAILKLNEARRRVGSELTCVGSGPQVKAGVQSMADLPLSLSVKYRIIDAEAIVRGNATGSTRTQVVERMGKLVKALNILEKYGCNLTNPSRPQYWRSVKHNNPVFKSTVDSMQGGRGVLYLYGYTIQEVDGVCFPNDIKQPDRDKVAEVTLEVMCLRLEVDMLIKGTHPHPEAFQDVIPLVVSQAQEETKEGEVVSPEGANGARGTSTKTPPPRPPPPTITAKTPILTPNASTTTPTSNPTTPSPNLTTPTPSPTIPTPNPTIPTPNPTPPSPNPTTPTPNPTTPMSTPAVTSPVRPSSPTSTPMVQLFCEPCDSLYHRNPQRALHKREPIQTAIKGHEGTDVTPAKTDSSLASWWTCGHCSTENQMRGILCVGCQRPHLATPCPGSQEDPRLATSCPGSQEDPRLATPCPGPQEDPRLATPCPSSQEDPRLATPCPGPQEDPLKLSLASFAEWQCKCCTMINKGCSVLCGACDRPRLATLPNVITSPRATPTMVGGCSSQFSKGAWSCLKAPCFTARCEAGLSIGLPDNLWICQSCTYQNSVPSLSPAKDPPQTLKPDNQKRQANREDSLRLIKHIKEAEKRGISPEEVCAALVSCGNSNTNPCDWLNLELPHLLDEICVMATSSVNGNGDTEGPPGPHVVVGGAEMQLSRVEAKQAWLAARGDVQGAVTRLLRDREAKMRELRSLGFQDEGSCQEALMQSGGQVAGALPLLQRASLEPFRQRVDTNQSEAPIDAKNPDTQRMCRRLLALYGLPSWGRCELALSLLQEEDVQYTLEDVVAAVKESQNREFILRHIKTECPFCSGFFPREKMQSLTSCQCIMCHDCFKQYFDLAVKEKHVMDIVCPSCTSLDTNDQEKMLIYLSTLEIQLRDCLEKEVFDIFTKKVLEHTMMKDPKFLWCHNSFCAKCKKPKQGLAGFLLENGIRCPSCRFQYALAKGGCMHFTCTRCKHQFCSGCNNPFQKVCKNVPCGMMNSLHAHHPRDCLYHLRDWAPERLQDLLQRNGVAFNTEPPEDAENGSCSVMQQDEAGAQLVDAACGEATADGQAGLCKKHYTEYLVSLINNSSLDPAQLYEGNELDVACGRYHVVVPREENEEDAAYSARQLEKLQEVQLGDKVPRRQ